MDMSGVERDLNRRINQSKEWLKLDRLNWFLECKIRKYPCKAKPVTFIDNPKREVRYGVRFLLEFITDYGTYESLVEVRIRDTRTISKDGVAKPPYIAIYAGESERRKDDLILWEEIKNTKIYKESLNLTIEEWYQDWIKKALRHDNVAKIFGFKKEIKPIAR